MLPFLQPECGDNRVSLEGCQPNTPAAEARCRGAGRGNDAMTEPIRLGVLISGGVAHVEYVPDGMAVEEGVR